MLEKTYPMRSAQGWAYTFIVPILVFFLLLLVFMPFILIIDFDSDNAGLMVSLGGLLVVIIVVASFWLTYKDVKNAYLVVDEQGIGTSSTLLNLMPALSTIEFHQGLKFYIVEGYGKAILGALAKAEHNLKTNDTTLIVVDSTRMPHKLTVISNNVWQIDSMAELQAFLQSMGYVAESIPAKDFIERHIPQLADMGKKAGFAAYSAIAFVIISLIILYLDKYATVHYGSKHWLWVILILSGAGALMAVKTSNKKQLGGQIIVSSLFALTFTLMFLLGTLAIVPIIGSEQQLTFEYQELNNYDEEKWVSVADANAEDTPILTIHCVEAADSAHTAQTTTVYKLFSIMRVNGAELCPDSKFLSDGVLIGLD